MLLGRKRVKIKIRTRKTLALVLSYPNPPYIALSLHRADMEYLLANSFLLYHPADTAKFQIAWIVTKHTVMCKTIEPPLCIYILVQMDPTFL